MSTRSNVPLAAGKKALHRVINAKRDGRWAGTPGAKRLALPQPVVPLVRARPACALCGTEFAIEVDRPRTSSRDLLPLNHQRAV